MAANAFYLSEIDTRYMTKVNFLTNIHCGNFCQMIQKSMQWNVLEDTENVMVSNSCYQFCLIMKHTVQTFITPATHIIPVKYSLKNGAIISMQMAASFNMSANNLKFTKENYT